MVTVIVMVMVIMVMVVGNGTWCICSQYGLKKAMLDDGSWVIFNVALYSNFTGLGMWRISCLAMKAVSSKKNM